LAPTRPNKSSESTDCLRSTLPMLILPLEPACAYLALTTETGRGNTGDHQAHASTTVLGEA
jgi:hypothetical protein